MKRAAICLGVLALVFVFPHAAVAQTAELPVPQMVVKDADGKIMAQVAGFYQHNSDFWPLVILDVEGTPAFLVFRPFGLVDLIAGNSGATGPTVYFLDSNCTGAPYVNQIGGVVEQIGTQFGVGGPDPSLGTYRLYRSTTMTASTVSISSWWAGGVCVNSNPTNFGLLAAEEVVPNPLEGFHGPTTAQPERVLTLSGGDRLNPSSP